MLVLDIEVFSRRGIGPAAVFLSRLAEHHDLSKVELLVDSFGYRTALSRLGLSGQVEYSGRDHIERVPDAQTANGPLLYDLERRSGQYSPLAAAVRSLLQHATPASNAQWSHAG